MAAFQFQNYLDLHASGRCLLLQVTLACPLRCSHCCVSSAPERREKLSIEEVRRTISLFADNRPDGIVVFTGGEPFSHLEVLRKGVSAAVVSGLKTYIISAAPWASTAARARGMISRFSDIDLLSLSIDHFHQKFVPISNIYNAIRASITAGVPVNILYTHDDNHPKYREVVEGLLLEFANAITVHETPLGKVGRAKELEQDFALLEDGRELDGCPLIGSPAVTATGNVSACCQVRETNLIEVGASHFLNLGDLSESWADNLIRLSEHSVYQAIKHLGPRWLLREMIRSGLSAPRDMTNCSSCQACSHITRDTNNIAQIAELIDSGRGAIILEAMCDIGNA